MKHAFLLLIGGMLFFSSCDDNEENEVKPEPAISEVEIGSGNNGIGVIGRDFHFNAEILAGDKIDSVLLQIVPKAGENYESDWSFEIVYMQYKGSKNATVHKHFDIPEDAVEGKYDFLIMITDENGTSLLETREINIYTPENLPVDPQLSTLNIGGLASGFFYRDGEFIDGNVLQKNDTIWSQVTIEGVKGDGIMYVLLIKKDLGHRPETTDAIDFSKAIVYDVYEHKGWEDVDYFSNEVFDLETFTFVRNAPDFKIGAEADNNIPEPSPISGEKSWESGEYYFGVVYKNTTYNFNFFHYIEFEVAGF
ncbi:DUF4625 domain-containing protein [Marivirga lumbricoides]|uniref:DUF4625 domain-containing protein n=1 Tax=Marivirga lumbricoides TaxID=1046115 RepID=UPI00166B05F4